MARRAAGLRADPEQQTAAPSRGAAVHLSWARAQTSGVAGRPLLEIDGLRKRFGGVAAADDITLTVRAGEACQRHRAERIGQDDAVQPDHRAHSTRRRQHPLRGPGDRRAAAARDRRPRGGPDLPEHPPLQQPHRDGEPARGRARAPSGRGARRHLPPAPRAPGGAAGGRERTRGRRDLRQPAAATDRSPRVRSLLRQPPPDRDRPGHHDAAGAPAARRAGGRREPGRGPRA